MNERALSVAVTHALTVAISTILVSGLIIGAGTLLESQEQSVGEDQLREVGSDAVSYVNTLDRLNGTGENVTVTVAPDYPERIVGSYRYTIRLTENSILINATQLGRSMEYPLETETDLDAGNQISGADAEFSLCDGEQITLGDCDT